MFKIRAIAGLRTYLALLLLIVVPSGSTFAATLPSGFSETVFASGIPFPTAMQFAPDGRLFVCQQTGEVRVIKDGALLATPFVDLTVDFGGERGLLGIAFDPNFSVNQFVYLYYTVATAPVHNRISRFTANGDAAAAGSETIIFELDNLSSATNHNGGALSFGPDGKLYAAVGENANGANAQTLSNVLGKMLRINSDGTIPADNPFFGTATGKNRAIWALGLRNPYTFAFSAGGTRLFINDVGQQQWEEINDGMAGGNYGWPQTEGAFNPATFPGFINPRYAYDHQSGRCAITGGAFYDPSTPRFPASYVNDYFFADFCAGWIRKLDPANNSVETFATGIANPVDLKVGSDGSLYYLARGAQAVYRISWSVSADSVTPNSGTGASQTFTFKSSDTAGAANLSSVWVWIDATLTGVNSCLFYYNRTTHSVQLLDDAGTAWSSRTIGAGGTLQNSQCSIAMGSGTTATFAGNTLTLTAAMTFAPAYAGSKMIALYAANPTVASGWYSVGTWTVPGATTTVSADSVTPNSGTGTSHAFAFSYSDTAGAADLSSVWVWIDETLTGVNSCLFAYSRTTHSVQLLDDAAMNWSSQTIGAGGTLQNSQCSIAMGSGTTATFAGNTLTFTAAMTFAPAYAGSKVIALYAANPTVSSGWQFRGTWTVP